jgi:hypothetical protein
MPSVRSRPPKHLTDTDRAPGGLRKPRTADRMDDGGYGVTSTRSRKVMQASSKAKPKKR